MAATSFHLRGTGLASAGRARVAGALRPTALRPHVRSTQRHSGLLPRGAGVVLAAESRPGPMPSSFVGSKEDNLREQLGPYMIAAGSGMPGVLGSTDGSDDYRPVTRVAYQVYADGEMVPCDSFDIAFQAVTEWMADRAVLPIENSLGGSIHRNYDLLMKHRLHIVGEVSVAVNHCLLAMPGVEKKGIKRVISHPQALSQTEGYCSRVLPGAVREEFPDTAGAAAEIAKQGWKETAAVASMRAAELYGLEVLDEAIQDDKSNVTRFMVLSRDPLAPGSIDVPFKTSIVFSLNEGPGMLFKALSVFALRDIDLTKIESRPMRSDPIVETQTGRRFKFLFYIDFVGTMSDVMCQNALRHLQEIAPFMRVLGSYPMDMNDPTKSH